MRSLYLDQIQRLPAIEDHARAMSEWRCLNDRARYRERARIMAAAMGRDFDAELADRKALAQGGRSCNV